MPFEGNNRTHPLGRNAVSQIDYRLTRHHRDCAVTLTQCENAVDRGDWGAAERAFAHFRDDLEAHFEAEETILFPRFESRVGEQRMTTIMRHEHALMREQLAALVEALELRDAERFLADSDALLVLMQ